MVFLDTISLSICGLWPMFWQSGAIFVAPTEEQSDF
jgi:hypothetical protein